MSDTSYKTIKLGFVAEGLFEDRKSRFIAQLCHVETESEAQEFLATVRAKHYNARHNVPAWILEDGTERASDDGEPSRTAGMPVLEVLRGAGLKNVCCVVTRYFGGTLWDLADLFVRIRRQLRRLWLLLRKRLLFRKCCRL